MAWTSISKRAVGVCVPKSWLDTFIDNLTFLYNLAGGSGTGSSVSLQNGSFENDTDADGIPDGWVETLGTGASSAFDTATPAHGRKAYKFSTIGSSDNYIESENFMVCSSQKPIVVEFLTKSSAAGVRADVTVRWYDKDSPPGYLGTDTLYSDGTTSPTAWTRFLRAATPSAGAVYFKLRLYGGVSGDDTAGDVYFDDIEVISEPDSFPFYGVIAEDTEVNTAWADNGSVVITLPTLPAGSGAVLKFMASVKTSDVLYHGGQRFRVGAYYSNEVQTLSLTYVQTIYELKIDSTVGGAITLYQQLQEPDNSGATITGKKDIGIIQVDILSA